MYTNLPFSNYPKELPGTYLTYPVKREVSLSFFMYDETSKTRIFSMNRPLQIISTFFLTGEIKLLNRSLKLQDVLQFKDIKQYYGIFLILEDRCKC